MKTTTAAAPKTAKQQFIEALEAYFATENAIHQTYLLDGEIEITCARETLMAAVGEIEIPEGQGIQYVNVTDDDDYLTEDLTADRVERFASENGYVLVKTENIVQRDKLEEFVRAEIWPAYNLERSNVLL